jgi:hypothetical protein
MIISDKGFIMPMKLGSRKLDKSGTSGADEKVDLEGHVCGLGQDEGRTG